MGRLDKKCIMVEWKDLVIASSNKATFELEKVLGIKHKQKIQRIAECLFETIIKFWKYIVLMVIQHCECMYAIQFVHLKW